MSDTFWRDLAACRLHDATMFDPPEGKENAAGRIAKAQRVCRGCPVQAECMDDAKRHRDSGVRGGVLLSVGVPTPVSPDRSKAPLPDMTRIEREAKWALLLDLHHEGYRNREIAAALNMSRQAVDNHLRRKVRNVA